MTRRRKLTIAAIVLVVAGLVWMVLSERRAGPSAIPRATVGQASLNATLPPAPATESTASTALAPQSPAAPDQQLSQMSDVDLQTMLDATAPTDVAQQLSDQLITIAADVLIADLTGQGRAQYPGVFDGQPATEVWSAIRVRAAVARMGAHGTVIVTSLYEATSPLGVYQPVVKWAVQFAYNGTRWLALPL